MQDENSRPATVPQEAIWNAQQNEWELGLKNDQGKHIGAWKWWLAPNGHLCCHTLFDDNGNLLNFKRFHPNGEVSRYGTYENGREIEDVYLKSSGPTTEIFAYGNTDDNVYKAVKRSNAPVEYDYYDKGGNHLNPIIEMESLMPEGFIPTPEDIAQTKKEIFTTGKGYLRKEFSQEFFGETIFSKVRENDKGIFDNVAGGAIHNNIDVVYHDGDLHVTNLRCLAELEIGVLVVNGNLTVDGGVSLVDDVMQLLFVTGNLKASNISTSGFLWVYGNVNVENCLFGDYNHGSAVIEGNLNAKFFYPEEYYFEVNGDAKFTYAFGNSWRLNQDATPEAFNWNGRKISEFVPFLHENIQKVTNFEADPTFLANNCEDGELFEYINRYDLIEYIIAGKPMFKD